MQNLWLYFLLEALRLQFAGDYTGAFDLYRHCLDTGGEEVGEVYYRLGVFYADMEQDSLALDAFNKAVELDNENDYYHERLGKMYLQLGELDQAIEEFERIYERNKGRVELLELLNNIYRLKLDYANVMRTIVLIEEADGASLELYLAKFEVLQVILRERDERQVIENLRLVIEQMAEGDDNRTLFEDIYYMYLNNLAYALSNAEDGDLKEAEEMSKRAVEYDGENANYLDTYAWILYKLKRYKEAKVYIERAVERLTEEDEAEEILKHKTLIINKVK